MNKAPAVIALVAVVTLLTVSSYKQQAVRQINPPKVVFPAFAASLANSRTEERFGIAPFRGSDGKVTVKSGRLVWTATLGYGRSDLNATVVSSKALTDATVEMNILDQSW